MEHSRTEGGDAYLSPGKKAGVKRGRLQRGEPSGERLSPPYFTAGKNRPLERKKEPSYSQCEDTSGEKLISKKLKKKKEILPGMRINCLIYPLNSSDSMK